MALFKRREDVTPSVDPAFDREYGPGTKPGFAGIYRCKGCGSEVVALRALILPTERDHKHTPAQGPIIWRLAVAAQG